MSGLANSAYTRNFGAASGGAFARFFLDDVQDELATAREGRPIFKSLERVEIILPGNPHARPVHNVTDEHKARWPEQYAAFKQGRDLVIDGTPLEQWPVLTRGMVLELKALEIHTVEQVAELSDVSLQRVGKGAFNLRERAKAYLDDAQAGALVEDLNRKLEAALSANAALQNQVTELGGITQSLQARLMAIENAPNAIQATIPGAMDPMEHARQHAPMETPSSSALDALTPVKRRGRPPAQAAE